MGQDKTWQVKVKHRSVNLSTEKHTNTSQMEMQACSCTQAPTSELTFSVQAQMDNAHSWRHKSLKNKQTLYTLTEMRTRIDNKSAVNTVYCTGAYYRTELCVNKLRLFLCLWVYTKTCSFSFTEFMHTLVHKYTVVLKKQNNLLISQENPHQLQQLNKHNQRWKEA